MAECLAIWLYDVKIATVERERRKMRLRYTPEAIASFPGGSPLLSLQLPLTAASYPNAVVRSFFDGLLPEGDARRAIAEDLRLLVDDTFGLARALGRDCAGALVIQPEADGPPPRATTLTAERLDETQLARLVDNLRSAPLGVNRRVRISLAGVQEKLLLTRLPDGGWGRPIDGTPSTHILKPEIRGYPGTVENEALCMRVAKHLGMAVADVSITSIGGRKLLVVSRYDRAIDPHTGAVERIHQEDLCQATGTPPLRKYEEDGGPSLRRIARVLQGVNPESLDDLLRAVTLNALIGNGDAHAKNLSLLHAYGGRLRLAPLYDLMSTLVYGDDRLAMYIDTVQRTSRVTTRRLASEACTWDIPRSRASAIVGELLDRFPHALERAAAETGGVPPKLSRLLRTQLTRLRYA